MHTNKGVSFRSSSDGLFYIVFPERAVELQFEVGSSGVDQFNFDTLSEPKEDFIKGLVALVVEETADGNYESASQVAGLLADYYSRDVLVLDAQLQHDDVLVGEMHFIDGETLEERKTRAQEVLDTCLRPGTSALLH